MLLNHKEALDFILATPGLTSPLTVANIEHVHSVLIKELGIDRKGKTEMKIAIASDLHFEFHKNEPYWLPIK